MVRSMPFIHPCRARPGCCGSDNFALGTNQNFRYSSALLKGPSRLVISVIPCVLDAFTEIDISRCVLQARAIRLAHGGPSPQMLATTRSALLLALLPGLAATDNAICKVLSPLITDLTSKTPLTCSCVSDGTGLNIGGDAECDIEIGPPPLEALADMKIKFHAGTTVRPCATPATASVHVGITLPTPSSTALDESIDTMVETAVAKLEKDEVEYDSSTNKITVTLSAEAGITKEVEVPIQKWAIADFFAKVGLTVEGSISGLTTTQTVDLCMRVRVGDYEICGADIPKCDGTDAKFDSLKPFAQPAAAQKAICTAKKTNWHELFGAPPIKLFPPQEMKFTDACAEASSGSPPPPPPTVTLTMQASGSVADYADTSAFSDYIGDGTDRSFADVLKARIGVAACSRKNRAANAFISRDCGILIQGLRDYASAIALTITPASVIITAVITASNDFSAHQVSDSLTAILSTADAASKELGITIEATPTVVVYTPPSSGSSSNAGAIAGAVISVLLFVGTIATVVYLVKKERIANPLDRLKEKLGMKKMPIAPEKGATELATAAPA